jgi:hypothetical protein
MRCAGVFKALRRKKCTHGVIVETNNRFDIVMRMRMRFVTTLSTLMIASGVRAGPVNGPRAAGAEVVAEPADSRPWFPPMVRTSQGGIVVWHPEAIRDGRLMIAEIASGEACDSPRAKWAGRWYPTYRVGGYHQALLPVRLGLAPGEKLLLVDCAGTRVTASVEVFTGDFPKVSLRVDPKFARKPPKRVVREQAAMDAAFATQTEGRLWSDAWVIPTPGPETSRFGVKRLFNNKIASRHRGLDLDGRVGAPVVAANDGVVVLAAKDYYYTGTALFIDHGDQLFTLYFHLSRVDVEAGDRVERGQLIGAVGRSGRVTGPHLHFAVKYAGTYVDPRDLLAFDPTVLGSGAPRAR